MTAEPAVLEADGIGKAFGSKVVLKAAGLALRPRNITALLGRNGTGKTTLFRIAAGTMQADHGMVRFRQQYRARPRLWRLAREGLMYSAQESALTSAFTVQEHVDAVARAWSVADRVDSVLADVAIAHLLDRRPRDLSGGERQRVSLGLAMLRQPDCLIMDEPFAGVAPVDIPLITRGLQVLRDRGTAIAISGHDVHPILDASDEVIWMVAGTTHWLGAPGDARMHHQFRREYLGPRALVDS